MKALTLWQPWAWAVAHAGKNVENRTWSPPKAAIGQRIAIHAGKAIDFNIVNQMQSGRWSKASPVCIDCPDPDDMVRGAIIATAVIDRVMTPGVLDRLRVLWGTPSQYGWVLRDVITLDEPIPCKGMQGLWTVPADIEARLRP